MRLVALTALAALVTAAAPAAAIKPSLLDEEPIAPSATATVSRLEVTLGEPFALFVTVTLTPGVDVNLPGHIELGAAFEAGAWTSSDRTQPDGTVRRDYEITVTAWELGDLVMPPVAVSWSSRGRSGVVAASAVQLRVIGSLAGETGELRPLARPVPLASRDWTLVWVAIGAAALVVAIVATVIVLRLRRRRRVRPRKLRVGGGPEIVVPLQPADDAALRALDELEASGALGAEDLTPAFAAMVEIVRTYLTRRFAVPAHELTTSELAHALAEVPAASAATPLVTPWFRVCDLVRYARARVDEHDGREAIALARRIVIETAALAAAPPPPAAPPSSGGPAHA